MLTLVVIVQLVAINDKMEILGMPCASIYLSCFQLLLDKNYIPLASI